jgi:hypothetical protein
MIGRMNSGDLAKDVTEAENHLQMHHERKVGKHFLLLSW